MLPYVQAQILPAKRADAFALLIAKAKSPALMAAALDIFLTKSLLLFGFRPHISI